MQGLMKERLTQTAISRNLPTKFIGKKVIYHPVLPSTNELAKQSARSGAPEGTIVVADQQTAGRGRLKRLWLSPPGSIALSIILYPDLAHLPYIIMLSSLAVVYTIEQITGLKAQIKWPNDILIDGKKVCGILIETDVQRNKVKYAIVGIGINVNIRMADFPDLGKIATSLSHELGHEVSRLQLLRRLLVEMERLYLNLPAKENLYREWQERLTTLGKKVVVTSGDTRYEGIAESVTAVGSLLLRGSDGSLKEITAGDVTLRTSS